jgi:hypothetical protein
MAMTDQELIDELVRDFAHSVVQQTEEIANGDAEVGNKYARRYINAFERLRSLGDVGRDSLASLFNHERADVRAMAATFLLRHRTHQALQILREVAATRQGLAAFGAMQAIKRWEEGDWHLDPQD